MPSTEQLCIWVAAFCAGLLAVMVLTGEGRPVLPTSVYTPDPDYLAKRCSQPRTGLITADLPACEFAFKSEDSLVYRREQ